MQFQFHCINAIHAGLSVLRLTETDPSLLDLREEDM